MARAPFPLAVDQESVRSNSVLAVILALIVAGSVAAVPGAAAAALQDNDTVEQDGGLNQTGNDTQDDATVGEAEPGPAQTQDETNATQNETEGIAQNETENESQVGVTDNVTENETEETVRQPGITEDGELNVTELYAAHSQILEAEGYRATENVTVRLNGSVAFTADVAYAASGGGDTRTVDANVSVAGKNSSMSVWSNESVTYVRTVEDGNVSYATFERGPPEYAGPEADQNETDVGQNETDENQTGLNETDENQTGLNDTDQKETNLNQTVENETAQTDEMADGQTGDMQRDDGMQMRGMHGMSGDEMHKPGHALLALEGNVGEATIEEADETGQNETDQNETDQNETDQNETEGDDFTQRTVTAPLQFEDYRGNPTGELSLVVDERGVVHSANVSVTSGLYAADSTYNLSVDELGVEEIDRPGWTEEVPENESDEPGDTTVDDTAGEANETEANDTIGETNDTAGGADEPGAGPE